MHILPNDASMSLTDKSAVHGTIRNVLSHRTRIRTDKGLEKRLFCENPDAFVTFVCRVTIKSTTKMTAKPWSNKSCLNLTIVPNSNAELGSCTLHDHANPQTDLQSNMTSIEPSNVLYLRHSHRKPSEYMSSWADITLYVKVKI